MSDFEKTLSQGFMEYAVKIANRYKKDPEGEIKCLVFKSVLDPLIENYNRLVKENEIPKLEDLAEDHKLALWEKSKQVSGEKFKRILICKAIYLLDVLTKE